MDITPRMQQILEVLIEKNEPISVNLLADRTGISKRTIQRELQDAKSVLKPFGLTFASKTGQGVWIEGSSEEREQLARELKNEDTYDMYNMDDRRKRLTMEILKNKGLNKLFYYSSQFGVSESTIGSDLKAIEGWLNTYGISIVRKPGSGVEISGKESDYRRAIRVFLDENIDEKVIRDVYEKDVFTSSTIQSNEIVNILNDKILARVIDCLNGMKDSRVLNLTESSYVGLVLHIAIAINRIFKEEIIDDSLQNLDIKEDDADYILACKIANELEEEFEIDIPDVEISFICLHLKGAKHIEIDWKQDIGTQTGKSMTDLINRLIDTFDINIAFELKQDEEFIQGLLAHLQPTLVRLVNDMKISNPMLSDIKREYADIYEKCVKAGEQLSEWIGKPVPDAEVGFLAIHFGAAVTRLEGKHEKLRRAKVGVICASGIGISRLMMSKLEKNFRERAEFHTYGRGDITPYVISRNDFFVTSVAVDNADIDIINVNPLLVDKDMENVSRKIYYYERIPQENSEEHEFDMELDQVNTVILHIKDVMKTVKLVEVKDDITFEKLVEKIADDASSNESRMECIEDDIKRRELLGTQVFAELGFALLHTVTDGVSAPMLSIYRTCEGRFLNDYFKGIPLVVVMLIPNDDNRKINSDILGFISSSLIEDYDFLEELTGADAVKIREAVNKVLKRYFNAYLNK